MSTADRLRWAADVLDGLPGLPTVSVTACGESVAFQVCDADDQALRAAVDAIAAVTGAGAPQYVAMLDPRHVHYTVRSAGVAVFAALSARAAADYADRQQVTA